MLVALLLKLIANQCADAHALPWLRIWHVLVTCRRVLAPHLCHLGGSHSTARDVVLSLFMRGMLSLLLHFAPPASDVSLRGALLSLREHPIVGRVATTLLEVLHANVTRRSPRASTVRDFLALLLLPSASALPLVGARAITVLVAHFVTCRQADLSSAGTPGGLRTMLRRHAGTAARHLDALALAGIGARTAAATLVALPCAPLGSSPEDDMVTSDVDSECDLADVRRRPSSAPMPPGCAPLVRALQAFPCPLDGSMSAAALLTAFRGVVRLGGVSGARSRHVAFAARLVAHPALPAFPRQTPACALAALHACARSGGALPCEAPRRAALKRHRCGGGPVGACVQVTERCAAGSRRNGCAPVSLYSDGAPAGAFGALTGAVGAPAGAVVALAGAVAAPACANAAPAGAVVAPVGAVLAPLGAEVAPAGAVVAPAGVVDAPVGAEGAPAGAAAAPHGAVGALSGAVAVGGRVVCRTDAAGGKAPFGAGGEGGGALVVIGEPLAGVRRVRVADDGGSVALAPVDGRELPLAGVAADARGRTASLGGWRRTCECGITLGVAQWELQAGVCACGRRLLYKRARDGPSQSLDVPLVPRVPRPMPDGYG